MIALLLALAVLTPAESAKAEQKRWESETLCWDVTDPSTCRPRVVKLGEWDPRPADKDWTR